MDVLGSAIKWGPIFKTISNALEQMEQETRRPAGTGIFFGQLLQTVKNKTTVLNLVFKELLQTSIPPLIFVLYAKGYHDFPLKIFRLTVPKNFVKEPFCVSENFWYRKMLRIREGAGITIFGQIVLSHSTESFRRGTLLCFKNFRVLKNFMPKKGKSRFSSENLLSHSIEKLRRGTLLCLAKVLVWKKFTDKRGGISRFSVENFLSHSDEKFRRGSL